MNDRKPVLGLIGGIGAGKSAAAKCLATRGGYVVDADQLGHIALEVAEVKRQLAERWGNRVLNPNGSANRRAIADLVFETASEREWLESVVFPVIGELANAAIRKAESDPEARFVVLDAAVLLEAGWGPMCDKIVYIDAPREMRLKRLAARSGWTATDLTAREAAQWPAERKLAAAHVVIANDETNETLQARVDRLLADWGWLV